MTTQMAWISILRVRTGRRVHAARREPRALRARRGRRASAGNAAKKATRVQPGLQAWMRLVPQVGDGQETKGLDAPCPTGRWWSRDQRRQEMPSSVWNFNHSFLFGSYHQSKFFSCTNLYLFKKHSFCVPSFKLRLVYCTSSSFFLHLSF